MKNLKFKYKLLNCSIAKLLKMQTIRECMRSQQFSNVAIQKGFTLVEMLIYMGLFSIFMVALTEVFTASLSAKIESQATASVDQDGRFIFLRLSHDISQADQIVGSYGSPADSLTIQLDGQNYVYSLDAGNLILTNDAGSTQLNSSRTTVSNLTFEKVGNAIEKDTVQIRMTLTSTATQNKGPETREFQTTIGMR